MSVQQFVAPVAAGAFFEEFAIDPQHVLVFVALAHDIGCVFGVERFGARGTDRLRGRNRLSAAAQTAARTCHELDEVAAGERAAVLDILHDPDGVGRAVRHADFQRHTAQPFEIGHQMGQDGGHRSGLADLDFGHAHAVKPAYRFDVGFLE